MSEKRIHVWVQQFKDREHLVLQWLDPDTGRRKSKSAGTSDPEKAEDARTDLESDLNNGRHQDAARMSWERFRELFSNEYMPGMRKSSRRRYGEVLDRFERLCNPRILAGVNERTLSAFVAAMRKEKVKGREGFAPASIRHGLAIMRKALGWAAKQRLIPSVPTFPTVKVPKKKPQAVPTESFERLLAKAPDAQMRAYLLAGWLAGLRLAEAFTLEWEASQDCPWVDLTRDRVWLPAEFVKANEDQWVPLDPELRAALEALPRRGRKVFYFADVGGRPISEGGVGKRVRDLARMAGVKLSMHALRRGFGCRYAGKVPAQVLQKLMRHANIKTTVDFYANVDAAVEEAILGPRCNRKRNNAPQTAPEPAQPPSPDDVPNS